MTKDELAQAFLDLNELVVKLRSPGGCPWDAQQTADTLKTYLLEEAYEVVDAVNRRLPEEICQELGDLLFQIFFLATVESEKGHFDLLGVVRKITGKMVHRHPHVFGDAKVANAEEVAENWEKLKKMEKNLPASSLELVEGVPASLPALLRAHRLMERGSRLKPDEHDPWRKVEEAFHALSVERNDHARIGERVGDLLLALVGLSRQEGLSAEHLLRAANERYLEEFRRKESEER